MKRPTKATSMSRWTRRARRMSSMDALANAFSIAASVPMPARSSPDHPGGVGLLGGGPGVAEGEVHLERHRQLAGGAHDLAHELGHLVVLLGRDLEDHLV